MTEPTRLPPEALLFLCRRDFPQAGGRHSRARKRSSRKDCRWIGGRTRCPAPNYRRRLRLVGREISTPRSLNRRFSGAVGPEKDAIAPNTALYPSTSTRGPLNWELNPSAHDGTASVAASTPVTTIFPTILSTLSLPFTQLDAARREAKTSKWHRACSHSINFVVRGPSQVQPPRPRRTIAAEGRGTGCVLSRDGR